MKTQILTIHEPEIVETSRSRDAAERGKSKRKAIVFSAVMALMLIMASAVLSQAQWRSFSATKADNNSVLLPASGTAESCAGANSYKMSADLPAGNVRLTRPACRNCGYILDNCSKNGWKPAAVCNACWVGNCYEGDN